MSRVQSRGAREANRRRTGDEEEEWSSLYSEQTMNEMRYGPLNKSAECRRDDPRWPGMPSGMTPRYPEPGQQMSPQPPRRSSPLRWEDYTSYWREEKPLADLQTPPARSQTYQPAKREIRDTNQGQQTDKHRKEYFQTPPDRHRRTLEEDGEEGSASSCYDSLKGSAEVEGKPDDRNLEMSDYVDTTGSEESGSGDEDGYVHVPLRASCS